jgi:CHAT domain-containing protein
MSGKVFLIPLSFLVLLSFKPPGPLSFRKIILVYTKANQLYNETDISAASEIACRTGFAEVISALGGLPRSTEADSLRCLSAFKLGTLYESDKDYAKATSAYLMGLIYAKKPEDKFRMLVFAGAGYYNLNNFDSASHFLLSAAEMPENSSLPADRIRLNNTLGVLFYDNGNYLQAKNYFTQALRFIEKDNSPDLHVVCSVQLNMATCNYKLGLYEDALTIYRRVKGFRLLSDPLYLNMGRAFAALNDYKSAIAAFRKVNISVLPGVLNEMARTSLESGNADSAGAWLKQYKGIRKSYDRNILDDGVNELYFGNLEIYYGKPDEALTHLQEAMIIFSGTFSSRDIHKNPDNFTGTFAYYRLFEVLAKKSEAWELKYWKYRKAEDLKSAYDTYESTIRLLSYIERCYEMDDAKILLKNRSSEIYQKAMEVCLRLDSLYPRMGFLKAAFLISEKDKASVMSSQLRERNFLATAGIGAELISEERNIRFNIARLNTLAEGVHENRALQKINGEKSIFETRLVNLHRKMEENDRFYTLRYSDDFPSLESLQKSMSGNQALISFFNTREKIEVFVLSGTFLKHVELDSGIFIRENIQALIRNLQSGGNGRHRNNPALKKILYDQLIEKINEMAGNQEEWIIVPDGIFFLLPMECLPANLKGEIILEKHIVSYEFSARFLVSDVHRKKEVPAKGIISFAPYSDRGADLPMGPALERLPYSKKEISELGGSRLADRLATKRNFLDNLNHFSVVHLATHAITDMDNPSASFIAFFPEKTNKTENLLFLDEIYSLRMDSCRMVVISACETGRGEFVHNEGVMSFARAFLYAGCPSTINTLWKADDHSTAEIIRLFYKHLEEGESKSRALRDAKLEFIKANPLFRDPTYWSDIILTGNPEALYIKKQPWIWAVFAISCSMIIFFTIGKRRKKADAFHS